jgi:hypothetical protein
MIEFEPRNREPAFPMLQASRRSEPSIDCGKHVTNCALAVSESSQEVRSSEASNAPGEAVRASSNRTRPALNVVSSRDVGCRTMAYGLVGQNMGRRSQRGPSPRKSRLPTVTCWMSVSLLKRSRPQTRPTADYTQDRSWDRFGTGRQHHWAWAMRRTPRRW